MVLAGTNHWHLSYALPWAGMFLPVSSMTPGGMWVMSLGSREGWDFAQGLTPVRGWLRLSARPVGFLSPSSEQPGFLLPPQEG